MNLIPGCVCAAGIVETKSGWLALDASEFDAAIGCYVDAGVRPEDLNISPIGSITKDGLEFEPEFIEELATTRLVYGVSGHAPLVLAVAAPASVLPAESLRSPHQETKSFFRSRRGNESGDPDEEHLRLQGFIGSKRFFRPRQQST
jgi:hypothetical protein